MNSRSMGVNIITVEDLQSFKKELIDEIRILINEKKDATSNKWLKSHQVMRMLTISPGTLQHLRINGTLPFTKIGGVIFYDSKDIENMLQQRKKNVQGNSNLP